ncbi:hypothetical protein E2C01_034620 [Portunus trituberculatus]|uniref:Uncharacterized protein n=1 Tax=Portunus trituberculatus TaxID=210409 RepID=A0A5B7F122_PORTR|nr:hypothetical protein [Portunus trituberculatus]
MDGGTWACGCAGLAAAGGGWWARSASAQMSIKVMDAPEPPRFDVQHYQFTISEFAREAWK